MAATNHKKNNLKMSYGKVKYERCFSGSRKKCILRKLCFGYGVMNCGTVIFQHFGVDNKDINRKI